MKLKSVHVRKRCRCPGCREKCSEANIVDHIESCNVEKSFYNQNHSFGSTEQQQVAMITPSMNHSLAAHQDDISLI